MDIEAIKNIASRFREALEHTSKEAPRYLPFNNFPKGCCGLTSSLLGKYLNELGFNCKHIIGTRKNPKEDFSQTHAWSEIEGIIIDITGDQFTDEDRPAIYVDNEDDWYKDWNGIEGKNELAGYNPFIRELLSLYDMTIKFMNNRTTL